MAEITFQPKARFLQPGRGSVHFIVLLAIDLMPKESSLKKVEPQGTDTFRCME